MFKNSLFVLTLISVLTFSNLACSQNTGGVFPPMVDDGHKSLQYRSAVDPDNALGKTGFAQRLHFQQAINGDFMWRIIGQTRKTAASDMDFDFVQAELFWELSDDDDKHKSGLRFDARLRDKNRPDQLGVNWMSQFNFDGGWSARALALASVQTGSYAADGVNLQTRGQLAKRLPSGKTLGIELYSNYGNTGAIGDFNEQNHTIGPFISAPLTKHTSIFAGPLFALSDAAPDVELRVWITRGF